MGSFLGIKSNTSFEKFQAIFIMSSYIIVSVNIYLECSPRHPILPSRGELGYYPLTSVCIQDYLIFVLHLFEITKGNLFIENSLKECNILLEAGKTSWLSTISHLLRLIDLNLNQIFQSCSLDPKQIDHKVKDKLKELYEERLWSKISKSNRLSYLYRFLKKECKIVRYIEDLFYHK